MNFSVELSALHPLISEMRPERELYKWREFSLSTQSRRFYFASTEIAITRMEFALIATLIERPDQVFSRLQLLKAMEVPGNFGAEAIVDSHVSRVRKKVRLAGGPTIIKAVHGIGFRLEQ